MTKKESFITDSYEATQQLAARLALQLQGKIIFLHGNLGAGKTTFVRGLAAGLGIADRVVSPTYTYERIYGKGTTVLHHFDLYRVADSGDTLLEEELLTLLTTTQATVAIEWPDKLAHHIPPELTEAVVHIYFEPLKGDGRSITIES